MRGGGNGEADSVCVWLTVSTSASSLSVGAGVLLVGRVFSSFGNVDGSAWVGWTSASVAGAGSGWYIGNGVVGCVATMLASTLGAR